MIILQLPSPENIDRADAKQDWDDNTKLIRAGMPLPQQPVFHPPVKRSITIAGHQTSISLEPVFWQMLEGAARTRGLPLSALVAQIDAMRIDLPKPPNLASTLRSWLLMLALHAESENHSQ